MFGIVDNRDEGGQVWIFSKKVGPKNTNHTVSLLKTYTGWVCVNFLGNATSTNKNRYLFGWAMEEVKHGQVQSIHFCFFGGRTYKIPPDRLFASYSQSYNTADVFKKGIYAKHCRTVAVCNEAHIHPWQSYVAYCYADLSGVWKLHKFLIVEGEIDIVIFRVGESCYSPHMKRSPMRKTSNADMDIDGQSYEVHQLAEDKMEDIEQMCHKFIAQSRWPTYIVQRIAAVTLPIPTVTKGGNANKRKARVSKRRSWQRTILSLLHKFKIKITKTR